MPYPPGLDDERFCDEPVYLDVPYSEKERAKVLGARWDPVVRRWYAPAGTDLWPLVQWGGMSHPCEGEVADEYEPYFAWEHCLID